MNFEILFFFSIIIILLFIYFFVGHFSRLPVAIGAFQ